MVGVSQSSHLPSVSAHVLWKRSRRRKRRRCGRMVVGVRLKQFGRQEEEAPMGS